MVRRQNGLGLHFVVIGLLGFGWAVACGGESSRTLRDAGEAGEGGEGASGGSSSGTGGSGRGGSAGKGGTDGSGATGGNATGGGPTAGTGGTGTAAAADLYFYRFYAEDAVGENGEDGAYVEFGIANQGTLPALPPHRFSLVLSTNRELGDSDDIEIDSLIVDRAIPAQEASATPSFSWEGFFAIDQDLQAGLYYVGGIIDADDEVSELDESNNTQLSNRIFVGVEDFDVVPTAISVPGGVARAGSELEVSLQVRAKGNQSIAEVEFDLVLSEDADDDESDEVLCSGTTGSLGPGDEILAVRKCPLPRLRGEYYLGVRLDPNDSLRESNEDDNVLFTKEPFVIGAPDVDLTVAGFSESGDLALEWQGDLNLSVTVANGGTETAPRSSIAMYLSEDDELDEGDIEVCARSLDAVAAGGETDVLIQCHLPVAAAGELRLLAFADEADTVFETDEGNNVGVAEGTVTITPPDFDLAYSQHGVSTSGDLRPDYMFGLTLQVQNPGTQSMPGFDVGVYFSVDDTITLDDALACSDRFSDPLPGATLANFNVSCMVPASLATGDYYLGVILDPNDLLPETNEGNNRGIEATPRRITAN